MKSHDKKWGDSTSKTSMLVAFPQQIKYFFYTEYFPRDGIMERVGAF